METRQIGQTKDGEEEEGRDRKTERITLNFTI